MLLGEYHHQLDEKNRLRIPAKLRTKLGSNYIIMKGSNNCLFVYSGEEMQNLMNEKLKAVPLSDVKAQKSIRMLFSSGFEVDEDAQGRFILPQNLREFASIKKNVVSIGVGNRIELWDEEKWQEYNTNDDFDTILGDLSQYGI
ncbi:MAG: division/cell wall cluster transcriptional repressor MraZ [Clostridia bacterium]|nr:division/cell wall cluster transcriptional repressor MraZ [Clostridia bacterium]